MELDRKTRPIIRTFFDNLELAEFVQETKPLRMTVGVLMKNTTILEIARAIGAPYPPDLNCGDIGYSNFTVVGSDPHGFDRDNDGIGCES